MKLQNQRTSYLFPFQMEKQFLNQVEQPAGLKGQVCKQKLKPFRRRGSRRPGSAAGKPRRHEKAKETPRWRWWRRGSRICLQRVLFSGENAAGKLPPGHGGLPESLASGSSRPQNPWIGAAFGKSNRYPDFSLLRNHLWSV